MARNNGISRRMIGAAVLAGAGLATHEARAQAGDRPQRPVRTIVPYGAGGATDTMCRLFAARLATILGQPFPVEKRPGGNAAIGAEAVLRSPHDGYTLFFAAGGAFLATPRMQAMSFATARRQRRQPGCSSAARCPRRCRPAGPQ